VNSIIKNGIGIGLFMFTVMSLLYPIIVGDKITLKSLAIGFLIWIFGGIVYQYLSHILKKVK